MSSPALNPLVEKIRAAHPGSYDDMDDAELTKRVLAKYPQYSDLAAPPVTSGKPDLGGMIQKDEATARVAGLPGGSPITAPATPAMAAIAGAGIGAGAIAAAPMLASLAAPAATAVNRVMARHPLMTMAGLAAAKKLPVVGPYLEHIPDWLPLLATEGGGAAEAKGAPIEQDATRQNVPYAGEQVPVVPARPQGAPIERDATLSKRNIPEYAGEGEEAVSPLQQAAALKQPVHDVVDSAIPPTGQTKASNLLTKARVDFHLQRGDVDGAQAVLDSAKTGSVPSGTFPPGPRTVVPSVQNIRENDAMVRAAQAQPGPKAADSMEDRSIQQEMNWNLERHGWAAESEARRQFIARNSTGVTKGDLAKAFKAANGTTPVEQGTEDLTEILRKSLAQVQKQKP